MKTLIAFCLFLLPVAATAETIQGRWKLGMAEDLRPDGTVARYPWGRHPVGSIVVDYVGTEQRRFYRFEGGKIFFGPAPNSTRSGADTLTRRLTLERADR